MGKKIMMFIAEVLITSVIFFSVLWVFNAIFDKDYSVDWEMVVQAIIFSVIYVPLAIRARNKKAGK